MVVLHRPLSPRRVAVPAPIVVETGRDLDCVLRDVNAGLQALESVKERISRMLAQQLEDGEPLSPGASLHASSFYPEGDELPLPNMSDRGSKRSKPGAAAPAAGAGATLKLDEATGGFRVIYESETRSRSKPRESKRQSTFQSGSGMWTSMNMRDSSKTSAMNRAGALKVEARLKNTLSMLMDAEDTERATDLWPTDLPLRPGLESDGKLQNLINNNPDRVSQRIVSRISQNKHLVGPLIQERPLRLMFAPPLDPDRSYLMTFETIGIGVLLHDVVVTPFVFAFDLQASGLLAVLGWMALLYWTLDFMLHWVTGFYSQGELVMNMRQIAKHYLTGWFFWDVVVLVSDYIVLILELFGSGGDADKLKRSYSFVRVVKICRLLRVLRILRLPQKLSKILALGLSQNSRSLVQGASVLFGMLIYVHLVCCYWVAIGRTAPTDTGLRWLDYPTSRVAADGETLAGADVLFLYITAIHWTLAQITPGPIDIVATNTAEKLFNSTFLISGLMFNGMIVSIFSGHIMQHIMRKRERNARVESVRIFLRQNHVGLTLAARVQKQVLARLNQVPTLMLQDVPALLTISTNLRKELLLDIVSPHMTSHMAFKVYHDMDFKEFQALCDEAVEMGSLSAQEDLFEFGVPAECAYYLVRGRMMYKQSPIFSKVEMEVEKEVLPTTWISEAALWSLWTHQGTMEVMAASSVLRVSSEKLVKVLGRGGVAAAIVVQYGINYHRRIIGACPPHAPYPTDLDVAYTEANNLLSFHVSLGLLESALEEHVIEMPYGQIEPLREEIRSEQCTIHRSRDGSVTRVVTIVVLKLKRSVDHEIFTRVGIYDEQKGISAKIDLPAVKLAMGELPASALQRVLDDELGGKAAGSVVRRVEEETTSEHSKKFSMMTTYHKIVHHAETYGLGKLAHEATVKPEMMEACPIDIRPLFLLKDPKGSRLMIYTWLSEEETALLSGEKMQAWERWLQESLECSEVDPDSLMLP